MAAPCAAPAAAEARGAFPSLPGRPRLLQRCKLHLARAQLFLEGKHRVALLLLISQRLSAAIILRWLCAGWSCRVGGPMGAVLLTLRLCSAGLVRPYCRRSREHHPWDETCKGKGQTRSRTAMATLAPGCCLAAHLCLPSPFHGTSKGDGLWS